MINAQGTKTALYGQPALLNLTVRPEFINKPLKDAPNDQRLTLLGKPPLVENQILGRLSAVLPPEDGLRLTAQMQKISFSNGEIVCQPNALQNYIYFPETAVFSQINILEDGRTVETAMIGSEGIAGLSAVLGLAAPEFWTQISAAGSAYRVCTAVFRQEFNRLGFPQTVLLEYVNSYIRQIAQRAICNNHHHIEERFSTWLLMLDDRSGADGKNDLALTQEQIAQFLGVHRPSVTCIAQNLRDNGAIKYLRGRISIFDRPKLETLACECYTALRQSAERLAV